MNTYFYSAETNAFYLAENINFYKANGSWPTGVRAVDDSVFDEFAGVPPDGKVRAAGSDGLPAWVNKPSPTPGQLIAFAEQKRTSLLAQANSVISDWKTELSLGTINDADKVKLTEWMQYIKAVKAIDVSTAPEVSWPTPPAVV